MTVPLSDFGCVMSRTMRPCRPREQDQAPVIQVTSENLTRNQTTW